MTSCRSCVWHTHTKRTDMDGDTGWVWRCWRESGCPSIRAEYAGEKDSREPMSCTEHWSGHA